MSDESQNSRCGSPIIPITCAEIIVPSDPEERRLLRSELKKKTQTEETVRDRGALEGVIPVKVSDSAHGQAHLLPLKISLARLAYQHDKINPRDDSGLQPAYRCTG